MSEKFSHERISENLKHIRENIERAAEEAGRSPDTVKLHAATKTVEADTVNFAISQRVRYIGENRVQELLEKYEKYDLAHAELHFIGRLQTNKVKYIIDKVELIHSVDSFHLAKQIEKEAVKKNVEMQILVQVNIAQEDTKFGIDGPEVIALVEEISKLPHVHVRGLMTSAPFVDDPEENRCYFKKLHQLFIDIREKNIDNVSMDILSMGMTNDYEVAIEEGSTMVRVGTGIFGARNYNK